MAKAVSPNPASYTNISIVVPLTNLLACCCMALFVFGYLSCKGGKARMAANDKPTPAQRHIADSLETAHNIDSADYVALFKNKTNIWLYKWLQNKQAKWANFHLTAFWHTDDIKQYPYDPGPQFYKGYDMFLEWSPDSSFVIDNGSDSVRISDPKKIKFYHRLNDVEDKIALIDRKNKKKVELLYTGPSSSVWGSHWIDSVQVSLLGYQYSSENKSPDTLLWIIDLKKRLFRRYKYHS